MTDNSEVAGQARQAFEKEWNQMAVAPENEGRYWAWYKAGYQAGLSKLKEENERLKKELRSENLVATGELKRAEAAEAELSKLRAELTHCVMCMDRSCQRCNEIAKREGF